MPILDNDLEREQERLIATNDVAGAVYFAIDNSNTADIKALQNMIIQDAYRNKHGEGLLLFAREVPEANKEALGRFIYNLGDTKSLIGFVKNVKGVKEKSLKRFVNKILKTSIKDINLDNTIREGTVEQPKENIDLVREASVKLKSEKKPIKKTKKTKKAIKPT